MIFKTNAIKDRIALSAVSDLLGTLQSIVFSLATTYFMIKLRGDKNLLSKSEK